MFKTNSSGHKKI